MRLIEETLEALHDVVQAAKARYVGASSMDAWEFSKVLHLQRQHRLARFVSMQHHYNLLAREQERTGATAPRPSSSGAWVTRECSSSLVPSRAGPRSTCGIPTRAAARVDRQTVSQVAAIADPELLHRSVEVGLHRAG